MFLRGCFSGVEGFWGIWIPMVGRLGVTSVLFRAGAPFSSSMEPEGLVVVVSSTSPLDAPDFRVVMVLG